MAARNSYATPMDFEYEDRKGPIDTASPFLRNIHQHSSFSSAQGDLGPDWRIQSDIDAKRSSQKRAFAAYESPQKTDAPALRPPGNGASVLFSGVDTSKKPSTAASKLESKESIWTPRTNRQLVLADSSAGSTPDTENWRADTEATPDTPTMGLSKGISRLFGGSKKNKEVILSNGSPGKGEISPKKPYSHAVVKRVEKRRDKERSKRRRLFLKDAMESETEAGGPGDGQQDVEKRGWDFAGFFHYIEAHPHLPNVLSYYLQLAMNAFIVGGLMYVMYSFWSTIRSDVDKASQEAVAEVLSEIAKCAKDYRDNHCDRGAPLPALEHACRSWENCMNRDYKSIGRAKVSAQTFGKIINEFIEAISWKTMLFLILTCAVALTISNLTFSSFRRHHQVQQPPNFIPPTPQHHPSGGWESQYGYNPYASPYGLPPPQWSQSMASLEPAPSQGSVAGPKSPRKAGSPRKAKTLEL